MKFSRFIACIAILVTALVSPVWNSDAQGNGIDPDCDSLKVSSTITNTTGNEKNGKVSIEASGGEAPYYYVFYYETGHLLTKDVTGNTLAQMGQSTFYCSVVDAKGCTKKIKIEIK